MSAVRHVGAAAGAERANGEWHRVLGLLKTTQQPAVHNHIDCCLLSARVVGMLRHPRYADGNWNRAVDMLEGKARTSTWPMAAYRMLSVL